ncbi:hypothetical protein A4A49_39560 [Nicotiana attenuata]|uniref:Uncharacterized protein n=2 Tax=Nicotiana attenuata TaxID=49451 RepID=A0A1J6KBI6_NICAT|nr:hypothetical protein A4A49_39560 [Nicotiana attenuata]
MVESINEYMISLNHSPEKSYLSSDTICSSNQTYSALEHVHTPEFLNTIKYSGVPNHALTLKDSNTKRVASELPTSNPDESNILPIETTVVLATPATEEQVEIASITGVLDARSEHPDEVGDLGGGLEEIGAFGATSNQPNEVLVARSKQPNEVGNLGGISEEIGALVAASKEPNEVGDLGGSSEEIGALVAASKEPNEVGF